MPGRPRFGPVDRILSAQNEMIMGTLPGRLAAGLNDYLQKIAGGHPPMNALLGLPKIAKPPTKKEAAKMFIGKLKVRRPPPCC